MTENVWENFLGLLVSVHSLLVEGGAQDKVSFMALGFADHPCHGRASLVAQLVKNSPANAGDTDSIPGWGRSPGEGIGYPLQYSWASLIAQLVKNPPAIQETRFDSWVGKIPWKRDRLPTPVFLGFPDGSDSKESTCNAGDLGSIPGLGRSPGGGHGNLLQYSCLENPHGQKSLAGWSPWGPKSRT